MLIGEKLRTLRKEKGLSQADLGKRIGVGLQVIHDWEKGKSAIPQKRLESIAEVFNKPLDYFKDDPEEPKESPFQGLMKMLDNSYKPSSEVTVPLNEELSEMVRDVALDHGSLYEGAALWLMKEGAKAWKASKQSHGRRMSGRLEDVSVRLEPPEAGHSKKKHHK